MEGWAGRTKEGEERVLSGLLAWPEGRLELLGVLLDVWTEWLHNQAWCLN